MIESGGRSGGSRTGFQFSSSIIQPDVNSDMVDEYELSGVKLGFRQGLRKGWSRAAFRQ